MTFREKVEKELEGLNRQQQLAFAWRCAVRALPFLGVEGHFSFWKTEDRQQHLYSVLYALDIACAAHTTFAARAASDAAKASDAAIATASLDAFDTLDPASIIDVAVRAAAAARAAAFANAAVSAPGAAYINAANAAVSATGAAHADAGSNTINIQEIILRDLESTKAKKPLQIAIADYGEVWDNFQQALKDMGCAYWGVLYEELFECNFEGDREKLETRINVPIEIRARGAAAVANFLEDLKKGGKRLNEARIIILGDKGAGKTSIARRLVDPNSPMPEDSESTKGVDTLSWALTADELNIRIWDFAGHTLTHAAHRFFLSERCLYLILYDGRTETRNRLEYWLDHMKNYGGDSEAFILVNERDPHPPAIRRNYLEEQYHIAGFYSFNIKKDKRKLKRFRKAVTDYIKNKPSWKNQEIPMGYYKVKEQLEALFYKKDDKEGKEYIKKSEFETIAEAHEVKDREELLRNLHELGVSLWYEKMGKYETLVLNPEWITTAVYKLINWVGKAEKYTLTLDDFLKVFKKDINRYPVDKHPFLFDLMKEYELAYEADNGKLIIPHLLKKDQPGELPHFPLGEGLMLKYKATQPLPPDTITRFIVSHSEQIRKENEVWRYGVILKSDKGSLALVREIDRTISVSVKGPEKTEFISLLRNTLEGIFETYKSKKPKLHYRVERYGEIVNSTVASNELWLPETKIKNHVSANVPYYDDESNQHFSLKEPAVQYKIDANTVLLNSPVENLNQNTFNFHDCKIELQGSLNELAGKLSKKGKEEAAEELIEAAEILDKVKEDTSKEEVRKKGFINRLKRIVKDLGDEGSDLHKTVSGIRHGVSIAQDIAAEYNKIAQWLALPQVPKPFLKKKK